VKFPTAGANIVSDGISCRPPRDCLSGSLILTTRRRRMSRCGISIPSIFRTYVVLSLEICVWCGPHALLVCHLSYLFSPLVLVSVVCPNHTPGWWLPIRRSRDAILLLSRAVWQFLVICRLEEAFTYLNPLHDKLVSRSVSHEMEKFLLQADRLSVGLFWALRLIVQFLISSLIIARSLVISDFGGA